jgi:hypothetical protein
MTTVPGDITKLFPAAEQTKLQQYSIDEKISFRIEAIGELQESREVTRVSIQYASVPKSPPSFFVYRVEGTVEYLFSLAQSTSTITRITDIEPYKKK